MPALRLQFIHPSGMRSHLLVNGMTHNIQHVLLSFRCLPVNICAHKGPQHKACQVIQQAVYGNQQQGGGVQLHQNEGLCGGRKHSRSMLTSGLLLRLDNIECHHERLYVQVLMMTVCNVGTSSRDVRHAAPGCTACIAWRQHYRSVSVPCRQERSPKGIGGLHQ